MKKTRVIVLAVVLTFTLFVAFIIVVFWHNNISVAAAKKVDAARRVTKISPDYLKLFHTSDELKFDETIESKDRNPISLFDYQKQFRICVYQINAPQSIALTKVLQVTKNDTRQTQNYLFNVSDAFVKYDLLYRTGPQDKVSGDIYLNLFGNHITEIANNDSLVYYYSEANNFYIKYQKNGVQDFCMAVRYKYQDDGIRIPSEIMIKKNNRGIYLIILTANNEVARLKPGTLFELIGE